MRRFKVIYEVEVEINHTKRGSDTDELTPYEKAYIRTHADSQVLSKYGLTAQWEQVAEPVIQRVTTPKHK